MAGVTARSPHTSVCHMMFWWTGCVAANGPAAEGKGARSLRQALLPMGGLAEKTAVAAAATTANAGTGQVGGGAGAGRAKTKTPAVESGLPVAAAGQCLVSVPPGRAKT